jgi:hypothetical protein
MRFAQSTTFLLALATGAHAQISADALVSSINNITQLSAQTNDIAKNIKFTNAFRLGSVRDLPVSGARLPKLTISTGSPQQLPQDCPDRQG